MLNINDLQNLLQTDSDKVLSLYLHVDPAHQPNQNETRAWNIYVKNALKTVANTDGIDSDAIAKHTKQYLDNYSPSSKSLVLFVNEDGVIKDVDLPIAIDNYHAVGEIDVVHLLWAMDEYERYLVVLVDSEQARFMSAYLGGATENDEMKIDFDDYDFRNKQFIHVNQSAQGDGLQGSGGEQFEAMKDEHIRRFHDDVAEQIREAINDTGANRVILGGSEQAAHQVQRLMHDTIKNRMVDILPITLEASESDVASAIRDTALNYERSQELDLVNEVISLAKSGGRGALGVDDIRDALEMQQVELLVLPYPMDDENVASNLTSMALEVGAEIELVHGSAAARLRQEANAAARLYYAMPETS